MPRGLAAAELSSAGLLYVGLASIVVLVELGFLEIERLEAARKAADSQIHRQSDRLDVLEASAHGSLCDFDKQKQDS